MRSFIYFPYKELEFELIRNMKIKEDDYINFFIDLKGMLGSYHDPNNKKKLVLLGKEEYYEITNSILKFCSSLRKFIKEKRKANIRFFLFYDIGRSEYHHSISPKYKKNRIEKLVSLTEREKMFFNNFLYRNYKYLELLGRVINDFYVIKLERLESDFVPYYIIKKYDLDKDRANIIHSNDKDMFQIMMKYDNIYQIRLYKRGTIRRTTFITLNNVLSVFLGEEDNVEFHSILSYSKYIIEFILTLSGDKIDGVDNLYPKLGKKTAYKIYKNFIFSMDLDSDDFNDFIYTFLFNPWEVIKKDDDGNVYLEYKDKKYENPKDKHVAKFFEFLKQDDNLKKLAKNFALVSYDNLIYKIKNGHSSVLDKIDSYIEDKLNVDINHKFNINHLSSLLENTELGDMTYYPEFNINDLQGLYCI